MVGVQGGVIWRGGALASVVAARSRHGFGVVASFWYNRGGGTMMTVNGLHLPASFAEFFTEHWCTNWDLKENVDADGHPLETGFEPLDSVERMEEDTAGLAQYGHISPEEVQRQTERERASPGFIPYIRDFTKIVQFGRTGSGAPFCFDFRENAREPSVISFLDGDSY
jgi:hypothetical protein